MYMQVTFKSGRVIETEPRVFLEVMEDARKQYSGEELSDEDLLDNVLDTISNLTGRFENGIANLDAFHLNLQNSIAYINVEEVETIEIFGTDQFAQSAMAFSDRLEAKKQAEVAQSPKNSAGYVSREANEADLERLERLDRFNKINEPESELNG